MIVTDVAFPSRVFFAKSMTDVERKQETRVQVSSRHPTLHACLEELRKRLEENHGNCAEALAKKAAADAQAPAALSPDTPSVIQVMMLFQQTKNSCLLRTCPWLIPVCDTVQQ